MTQKSQTPASRSAYHDVGRILAIGDLHGNYAGFRRILEETGMIDGRGRWKARDTHLVQLGDILGRGGEPGKIFNLLRRLESEAPGFNSRVHVLLGNHEAMSVSGLMVYNTLEEFRDLARENLVDKGARAAKAAAKAEAAAAADEGGKPAQENLEPDNEDGETWRPLDAKLSKRLDMLGCRQFRAALSPKGKVGAWLIGHDSAINIDGTLFVHGGLNRAHGLMPLDALNDRVRCALADDGPPDPGKDIMLRRDGPQWNREFTLKPHPDREAELDEVLAYQECRRMVVGHTPTSCIDANQAGRILPLYGDKLWCADTGIGKAYGQKLSALSIEGGAVKPVYF